MHLNYSTMNVLHLYIITYIDTIDRQGTEEMYCLVSNNVMRRMYHRIGKRVTEVAFRESVVRKVVHTFDQTIFSVAKLCT